MEISIRLFGEEARIAGRPIVSVRVEGDAIACAELRKRLAREEPALEPLLGNGRFAVNHEFVGDDARVGAGDEVALIGMVSGG